MNVEDKNPQYDDQYPVQPRFHPVNKTVRGVYDTLASARLAMFLLVAILACCIAGVTVFRGDRASAVIFDTLWFNGLLVLLIANVGCCFFGRMWHRRITVISGGMILFHVSFIGMFAGIIYNSLFYFRGEMRLTEGETLPNDLPTSYDRAASGRFFKFSRLKGETTLLEMHPSFKVNGLEKRAGYDIAVRDEGSERRDTIYVTKNLTYRGITFYKEKEGFSPLITLHDKSGKETYGAFISLQSFKQADEKFIYTTGAKGVPSYTVYPQYPDNPVFDLKLAYQPEGERSGSMLFSLRPFDKTRTSPEGSWDYIGSAKVGEQFKAGDYSVSAKEIRYWAGMSVRYDPGKPIVLACLWISLAGMVMTTIGRVLKDAAHKSAGASNDLTAEEQILVSEVRNEA